VYHVELRRFPHVARGFNLSAADLDSRIVSPFVRKEPIEFEDRRWDADKTRVTIYEGPAVAAEDRGLGRGWSLVTRDGEDVSAKLLEAARVLALQKAPAGLLPDLKQQLLAAAHGDGIGLADAVTLAARVRERRRPSEALALAEQAAWELLHEGGARLIADGRAVSRPEWEGIMLDWQSWLGSRVRLRR
jgi:hypothetical protein